jgi:ribosomal protein S18 acetylase RimI-like enzyme
MTTKTTRCSAAHEIRRADVDDSAFLARVVAAASRSHLALGPLEMLLDDPEEAAELLEWLTLSEVASTCHYSRFLVLGEPGAPKAALAAFDPGDPTLESLAAALFDAFDGLGFGDGEVEEALTRLASYRSCEPDLTPGVWTVEWVATAGEHRRGGLCRLLLERALAEGRRRGLTKAQISIMIGNEPARRAYRAMGFREVEELRKPDFEAAFGSPGMIRMLRDL